jgi:hypothetical protein
MEARFEPRLETFIEYVEAEVRHHFSDQTEHYERKLEFSREGAAMVLAWFGLADLDEDVDGLIWRACRRLSLPHALKD